jgi:hypothetical protein
MWFIPIGIAVVQRPKYRRTIAIEPTPREPQRKAIDPGTHRIACISGLRVHAGTSATGRSVALVKQVARQATPLKVRTAQGLADAIRPR